MPIGLINACMYTTHICRCLIHSNKKKRVSKKKSLEYLVGKKKCDTQRNGQTNGDKNRGLADKRWVANETNQTIKNNYVKVLVKKLENNNECIFGKTLKMNISDNLRSFC